MSVNKIRNPQYGDWKARLKAAQPGAVWTVTRREANAIHQARFRLKRAGEFVNIAVRRSDDRVKVVIL